MGDLNKWQKILLWGADHIPNIKFTKDLAYKIISDRQVGYQAGATKQDVIRNLRSNIPKDEDANKYMFVYGADTRRPETSIGQAYDWADDIKENEYQNVKSYEGVLNPYGEYLVDSRNKGLVEALAKAKYSPVSNINNEYIDWNTFRMKKGVPYYDDVHGYRPTFHYDQNGNTVVSSSDLYDFGKNYVGDFTDLYAERSGNENDPAFTMELQRRALNSVGQPYLLVQKNIPIRYVDNPQGDEIWRINNFRKEVLDPITDQDIARITSSGYIEPSVVTAKSKKANGGNLSLFNNHFGSSGWKKEVSKKYKEVTIIEEPWADDYFRKHPEVSGMAIGAGMNGVEGERRVIINPYSKNINREAVLQNERARHYMEENNFKLPNVTQEQMDKYINTPYQNDTLNIGRTEAARYISGDKHLLTPDQIDYVNKFRNGGKKSTNMTISAANAIYDTGELNLVPKKFRGNPFIIPAVITVHKKGGILKYQNSGKIYQKFTPRIYDPNKKLNWSAKDWLEERAENDRGPKYTQKDIRIFNSHVPEYRKIERESRKNGTWLKMPDGSTYNGDPREWVIMQSKAFKENYQENPWYTGQAEWETKVTLPDGSTVDSNKVKRARYHNGEMWFSNDAGYAQYFADIIDSSKLDERYRAGRYYDETIDGLVAPESKINGKVFLSGIPKTGNYRHLDQDHTPDYWMDMPYELTENGIIRTASENIQNTNDYRKGNIKISGEDLKTDDLVNHSRQLGDDGLFIYNVNDGPSIRKRNESKDYKSATEQGVHEYPWEVNNARPVFVPINEFISQPGFTEKIKFIRGNNGNFDPNTDDKYSAIFNINSPLFAKKGGKIHIKKKNRGKFTESAKRAGMGVQEFARHVLANKDKYSSILIKRANFARNAKI